ncbi:MAG: hypothetical protein EA397_07120 [Deltaproteobacteria bacterium]|nr:MAG: hypothetical protein EA397_07120 [Deltaproteobacteria bacterium]
MRRWWVGLFGAACVWGTSEPAPPPSAAEEPAPPTTERQFCVLRHAEAYQNLDTPLEELPLGMADSLTDEGQAQARRAGQALPRPVGMVVASPTGRTLQTAELLGVEAPIHVDARAVKLSGEVSWRERVEAARSGQDLEPDGGESFALAQRRATALLKRVREQTPEGHHAVVVTHGDQGPILAGELASTPLLKRPTEHAIETGELVCQPMDGQK